MSQFDNTEATAREISVPDKTGQARIITYVNESVGPTDQNDYFTFVAPQDGWFYADAIIDQGPNIDLRFRGTDGANRGIYADNITDIATDRTFIANYIREGETYVFQVSKNFHETSGSQYDLRVIFSENNETFDDSVELTLGETRNDNLYWGDPTDYFVFTAPESGALELAFTGPEDRQNVPFSIGFIELAVYDSHRVLIDSDIYTQGEIVTIDLDVTAGRTYFVSIREAPQTELLSWLFDGGAYTLTTTLTPIPPDNNETFATAVAQQSSFSVADEVGGSDAGDVYSLSPTANGIVALTLTGLFNDADVLVYADDGALIAQSRAGSTSNEALDFAVTQDQTYYVRVVSKNGDATTYTLESTFIETAVSEGDVAATSADAQVIGLSSSVESDLESSSDRDWFEITIPVGATYVVRAEGTESGAGTLDDPDLVIRRANESFFTQDTGNADQGAEVILSEEGTYLVSVRSFSGGTGTYTLSVTTPAGRVTPADTADIAGSIESTATLDLNTSSVSQLETSGDSDWFRVSVAEGEDLTVFVEGAETDKGTLTDPVLVLRDSDGGFIAQTDPAAGRNVQTTIETAGEYWVQVTSTDGHSGTYTITSSSDALPRLSESTDYAGDTTSNAIIVAGQNADATLDDSRDKDWIKVTLEQGQRLDVTVTGNGDEDARLNDPDIILRTENGGFVDQDFGNPGESANVTIAAVGTYWIEVRSFSGDTGDYTVSVTDTFAESSSAASQQGYTTTTASDDLQLADTSALA